MPGFVCKKRGIINGFEVALFELGTNSQKDEMLKLEEHLKNKIRKMKLHNPDEYRALLQVPGVIENEFTEKILAQIKRINIPSKNKNQWFDVRRSRVTEIMAQCLLEREYNCIFYEEADKRINTEVVNRDKHTPGIDVTGIYHNKRDFKFVACEVKASKGDVPCEEAKSLLTDIYKGYTNEEDRLSKEILQYYTDLNMAQIDDILMRDILAFLIKLIDVSSSHEELIKNVIFIPFLIRYNPKIIEHNTLEDFADFKIEDMKGIDIKGVIWAFNKDINTFANDLYDEVLANG